MKAFRHRIQARLRAHGVEIRKIPGVDFRPVPVFHMAVQLLMARKGRSLSFVQIGANDGMFGDPLRRYIVDDGWRGILVEPQPNVFAKLRANYSKQADQLEFLNVAISPEPGQLTLYRPAPGQGGGDETWRLSVVSFDPKVIAEQLRTSVDRLEKIFVESITLDQLFEDRGITECDVLQIDTEGLDWGVLKSLSLSKYKPSIIQFESGHLCLRDCDSAARYLVEHGYEIYWGGNHGDALALKSGSVIRTSDSDTDRLTR